jgi:aldose 1-epimerase
MTDDVLLLTATDGATSVTAEIDLACGGRVRQVTIERGGESVELLVGSDDVGQATATSWGSFPMAPWAGRLRHGRFEFEGRTISIDLNHEDGTTTGGGRVDPPVPALDRSPDPGSSAWRQHAIHGTTFQRPWSVADVGDDRCALHCPIDQVGGWPFPGTARQSIRLRPDGMEFTLSVEAAADTSFPAAIGWHPWFVKPETLDVSPTAMYVLDEIGLPTGELRDPTPGPWDDCFRNSAPVRLVYRREIAPVVTVTSDCDHLVVYDRPEHATCVEPQSGPPDAPNVDPNVVFTGSPLMRTMGWSW